MTSSPNHQDQRKKFWKLNKEMIRYKLHYFAMCGTEVGVSPYLSVFAKTNLRLSATSVGVIATVMQFSLLVVKPAFGALADHFNKLKAMIIVLVALQAIFYLGMLAIPRAEQPELSKKASTKPQWINTTINSTETDQSVQCTLTNCNASVIPQMQCTFSAELCVDRRLHNWMTCEVDQPLITICNVSHQQRRFLIEYQIDDNTKDIAFPTNFENQTESLEIETPYSNSCRILAKCSLDCKQLIHLCLPNNEEGSYFDNFRFWTFGLLFLLGGLSMEVSLFLSDAGCYETLRDRPDKYGKQRLWGAVAWASLGPLSGFLIDLSTGDSSTVDYSPGWYLATALAFLLIFNILSIDLTKPNFSSHIIQDVKSVFASEEFVVMVICAFVAGLFSAIIWNFVMWYLESLGGNRLLMGLALTFQCMMSEVPFMFFSGWIINKIGHLNVMTLTFIAFALRFFGYFYIQNPWLALPVQMFHGITFGLFYTALTSYAKRKAPPGTEATTQGILCGTFDGLGIGTGSLLFGISFDRLGDRSSFLLAAILSGCAAILNAIVTCILFRQKSKLSKNRSEENAEGLYDTNHQDEQ